MPPSPIIATDAAIGEEREGMVEVLEPEIILKFGNGGGSQLLLCISQGDHPLLHVIEEPSDAERQAVGGLLPETGDLLQLREVCSIAIFFSAVSASRRGSSPMITSAAEAAAGYAAYGAALALVIAGVVGCFSERTSGPSTDLAACSASLPSEAFGSTIVIIRDFQFNPALYVNNGPKHDLFGYIVFTYTFHLWGINRKEAPNLRRDFQKNSLADSGTPPETPER